MMSARYARGSRGIQDLPGALDLGKDVAVLDRVAHHEVDLRAEQFPQVVEQVEVRVDEFERVRVAEVGEQVDIALAGAEVVAKC